MKKKNHTDGGKADSPDTIRTCEDVLMVLPDYRISNLPLQTMIRIKDHLKNCFHCQQSLFELNRAVDDS